MKNLIALLTITLTVPFILHASDVEILGNVTIADDPDTPNTEGNLRVNGALVLGNFAGTNASGIAAVAAGTNAKANGDFSVAYGYGTKAEGMYNIAIGTGSYACLEDPASGEPIRYAFAYGRAAARANHSFAFGEWTNAKGACSFAFGKQANANSNHSIAFGYFANVQGLASVAIGNTVKSTHNYATAIGQFTEASGYKSVAMGSHTTASGWGSVGYGFENTASGYGAVSLGWQSRAEGSYSFTLGHGLASTAYASYSIGTNLTSNIYRQFTIGYFNEHLEGNTETWVDTDPFFVIANGKNTSARSNALVMSKNGNTKFSGKVEAQVLAVREASGGIPMGRFGR